MMSPLLFPRDVHISSIRYGIAAILVLCVCLNWTAVVQGQPTSGDTINDGTNEHGYPLVVRLAESMFQTPQPDVAEVTAVDQCVLGTRNRGSATIQGQLYPDFLASHDNAQMSLVFAGATVVRTAGHKGPATIHSTSSCDFRIQVPISFQTDGGFQAGDSQARVTLTQLCQRVSTSAPGLRGRIVRRVATNQLEQKQGQLRCIAKENTEARLVSGMNQRVDDTVARWNGHWRKLRLALQQQSWYPQSPALHLASDDQHLIVSVWLERQHRPNAEQIRKLLTQLPACGADSLTEIYVHDDWSEASAQTQAILLFMAAASEPWLVMYGDETAVELHSSRSPPWSVFSFRPAAPDGDNSDGGAAQPTRTPR